jgi:hypothetical protein
MNERARRRSLGAWMLSRGTTTWLVAVVVVSLVKYGVGLYPSLSRHQALAAHWRNPLDSPLLRGAQSYHLRMPVSAVAAGWLHLTGDRAFVAFHLVLALAAIALPFAMPTVRRSPELRLFVGLLLIGGPVPPVLVNWIGSSDAVTIGAATVAALARSSPVAAAGWMVFAFNNAPTAALALLVVAVVLYADGGRATLGRIAAAGGGAVAGYIGIRVLDSVWGGGASEFELVNVYGYSRYLNGAVRQWPLIAVSVLGIGWVIFTRPVIRVVRAARVFVTAAAVASVAVPFLAIDESRITASVLWASVLVTARLVVTRVPVDKLRPVLIGVVPAALLVVVVLAWDSKLVYAGWSSLWHVATFLTGHGAAPPAAAWRLG